MLYICYLFDDTLLVLRLIRLTTINLIEVDKTIYRGHFQCFDIQNTDRNKFNLTKNVKQVKKKINKMEEKLKWQIKNSVQISIM